MEKLKYAAKRLKEYKAGIGAVNEYDVIRAIVDVCREEVPEWTFSAKIKEPQLIQGYTAENWQEIIDGGYLCEFSLVPFNTPGHVRLGQLEKMGDWGFLQVRHSDVDDWSYCRPAQIKGVMRPIFVEPVDKEAWCVFFYDDATGTEGAAHHTYNGFFSGGLTISNTGATKYIEL